MSPIVYALMWLRAAAAHVGKQARLTWQTSTWFEAVSAVAFAVVAVSWLVQAVFIDGGDWGRALYELAAAVTVIVIVYEHAADRRIWQALGLEKLASRQVGRYAEVTCAQGRTHRFLYGPNGWEEAGPASMKRSDT